MNHSVNINHDAVLRARVSLLGSEKPTVRQRVAAYRVLVQVSPLAYLSRLAVDLIKYSKEFADQPETVRALRAESVAAARRLCELESGRQRLLIATLTALREQLDLMERREEASAVTREIALLESASRDS
ncbi:hypothetical protein HYE82_31195 [Streptomyces sp. BR123]|uniref:hypothetical protein n=1 Tax=Streptomyces sp. BR123 TaxID=2749828 RepID=UPI0015C463D2|nr:hypothetical protein [Streptomyces sp. BR123]NXY98767.1 hypothetical protein [Streptomyces sp. BR123]